MVAKASDYAAVPGELKDTPRWIVWKYARNVDQTGQESLRKVPQSRHGGNADAHASKNWMSFKDAGRALNDLLPNWPHGGGLGFVFTDDDDIGGVDLDGCYDSASGKMAGWAQEVIDLFSPSYVELSPSKTGVHIYAKGAPDKLRKTDRIMKRAPTDPDHGKDPWLEAYVRKRFFTVTGNHFSGSSEMMNLSAAWAQLEGMLVGEVSRADREKESPGRLVDVPDLEEVRSALATFSSDELGRNGFVAVGMALKGEFGEAARETWLDWMSASEDDDATASEAIWEGLPDHPRAVGLGTIFYHAKAHGWKKAASVAPPGAVRSSAAGQVLRQIISTCELWTDERGEPYATIVVSNGDETSHREHHRVGSERFSSFVERDFWQQTGTTPKREELKEALSFAKAQARFAGQTHRTWIRVAAHDGKLYLDLTDDQWRVIEIDAVGYRVCSAPPVRFRRTSSEAPLPVPDWRFRTAPEVLADFAKLVRPKHSRQLKLLVGWMVACLRPDLPIPSLVLACEWGSAKTSSLRAIKSLLDPRYPMTPGLPSTESDLTVAAFNQWVVAGDNVSQINNDMADVICRLVTGGGSVKRKLYEDEETHALEVKRPVILTALQMPNIRGDFVDRSIALDLAILDKADRRPEQIVQQMLVDVSPEMLDLLLTAASTALLNLTRVQQELQGSLPRMADFVVWCEAAASAFGWDPGEFLLEYDRMYHERMVDAARDDTLLQTIAEWLASRPGGAVRGKASDLLSQLRTYVERNDMVGAPPTRDQFALVPEEPPGLGRSVEEPPSVAPGDWRQLVDRTRSDELDVRSFPSSFAPERSASSHL